MKIVVAFGFYLFGEVIRWKRSLFTIWFAKPVLGQRSIRSYGRQQEGTMTGAIRKRDILAHPFVTVHCFGWTVFLRTLLAGRDETFLTVVAQAGLSHAQPAKVPDLVERCIQLELRAEKIFEIMALKFPEHPDVEQFFRTLAAQELDHAHLLQLCRAAAGRGRWIERHFDPWRDVVPRLEDRMREAELSSDALSTPKEALRLVIEIESSEINRVFRGVVQATDSDFVRRLRAFQEATTEHLKFICQGVKTLEPKLEADCEEMRTAYQEHVA